jgi:glycine C-acetyltransferase
MDPLQCLHDEVAEFKAQGALRPLRILAGPQEARCVIDGKEVVNLSSNNYLGLTTHPKLKEAALAAVASQGAGSGSVRPIAGTMASHLALETQIGSFKHTEAAVVFQSGFAANAGTVSALLGKEDVIVSDELNHASIIDGIRLSRAGVVVFPHSDPAGLEDLLRAHQHRRRRIVVVDGVFSMDGDIAPLPDLLAVARRWGALVVVDDAHGTGTRGPGGAGALAACGLRGAADLEVGTLGKALGSFGAFVAGSRKLIRLVINKARSFIFTCGLPPSALAAASAALDVLRDEPDLPVRLMDNARQVRETLGRAGFDLSPSTTHILPLHVGDSRRTMALCERLLDAGVFAQGIRYPTVPEGTERLRLTPMATHTADHLAAACRTIVECGAALGLPAARATSRASSR